MRKQLFFATGFSLGAMAGTALAQSLAPNAPHQVSGDWTVDLRTVLAVGAVVLPAAWWVSAKFKELSDWMGSRDERFARIEASLAKMEEKMDRISCGNSNNTNPPPDDKGDKNL